MAVDFNEAPFRKHPSQGDSMKRNSFLMMSPCVALLALGCQGGGGGVAPGTGGMAFQIDFGALTAAAPTPTITAVRAVVSRTGYTDLTKDLTVSNNTASGQIDNLDAGTWHVQVDAYENTTHLYTGATDVNVIAGAVVQCNILFDPVPPTQGSVVITVGMNPMPGFSALDQSVSEALFDRASRKLYLLDGPAKIIGVYDADTLVRIQDLALTSAPLSLALDSAGTGIYLGHSSGEIHRLDIASGGEVTISNVAMPVQTMAVLNGQFLAAGCAGTSTTDLKVVDLSSGLVVSTRSIPFPLSDLLYNPAAKTVYSQDQGVSPADIHYVKVDDVAGTMLSDGDSIYNGEYSFGTPLRIINDGTRLAASSGSTFTSREPIAEDLLYGGNLGYSYTELSADDARGKLFLLSLDAGVQKLLVIDENSDLLELALELPGTPVQVFNTPDSIVVLSTRDARPYAKVFAKTSLGL